MNIFIDANIFLDYFDTNRENHIFSKKAFEYCIINGFTIFTSCDLITTIYYINSKYNKNSALHNISIINKLVKIVEFSNQEITKTYNLMTENREYKDLEDTLQYILAKKVKSDFIITNDKNFISKDIPTISSKEFCLKFV